MSDSLRILITGFGPFSSAVQSKRPLVERLSQLRRVIPSAINPTPTINLVRSSVHPAAPYFCATV
jgi:hypothetical protein